MKYNKNPIKKKEYQELPTMETIKGIFLMGAILKVERFDVNPKYPKYWEVCKWATD